MAQPNNLRQNVTVIKLYRNFILVVTLGLTVVAALYAMFLLKPTYSMQGQLLVISNSANIDTDSKLIQTYQEVLRSPRILDHVADKLHIQNMNKLRKELRVENATNSQVISVILEDKNQSYGVAVVNTIIETFQTEIGHLVQANNVQILHLAKVKDHPIRISPAPYLYVCIAFVLGLMLSVGIAFLRESLNRYVRLDSEVEELGLVLLGSVPVMNKNKMHARWGT